MTFEGLWDDLLPIGRDAQTGGYRRFAWTPADLECREWFAAAAQDRGLDVESDRNGNLWAWWGDPAAGNAVVVGSHLDSVPDGGAYDGPLGVVSAFAALDDLRARGRAPLRPVAVAAFSDEEGARFGVACGGSRLLTGALDAQRARGLRDSDGTTMAEAMATSGHDPVHVGADPGRLAQIGCFVELHIEQGRVRVETGDGFAYGLAGVDSPVGLASGIWPHGRWRIELTGRADHAGTTRLEDRDDPMLLFAATVLAAREAAIRHDALATIGKVRVEPNGVNAIPREVVAWLDARGADEPRVRAVVAHLAGDLESLHTGARVTEESWTGLTTFDETLRSRLAGILGNPPVIPTGAGHDAGVLAAAGVPAAMVFVRNPTGTSHSPLEHVERADCLAGVAALASVIADLATDAAPNP
ncbi:MAG TPA: allantoate amidohydrolase [Jiangellaceae bacterium]|nr:allantoate amidohydrolase [Jiangellaceae bacterium]